MIKIHYRKVEGKYPYELSKGYSTYLKPLKGKTTKYFSNPYVCLTPHGFLSISVAYRWDGPSGPTIDTENFMRGSLVHDALYQLIREGVIAFKCRKLADKILYKICREDGMSWFRAQYVYYGVRWGGGRFAS